MINNLQKFRLKTEQFAEKVLQMITNMQPQIAVTLALALLSCPYRRMHDQVYETVRRYGHDSGEIWHRMQKTLPGDLAIQTR